MIDTTFGPKTALRGSDAPWELIGAILAAHPGWHACAFEESGLYGVRLYRDWSGVDLPGRYRRPHDAVRVAMQINEARRP